MTTSRYEARIDREDPNRVIVIDSVGQNHKVIDLDPAFGDAVYAHMSDLFNAGVKRYGSVDEFTRALRWHNELTEATS